MAKEEVDAVSLTFEDDGVREFRSWDGLESWLGSEKAKWDWLNSAAAQNPGNIRSLVQEAFTDIRDTIARLREQNAPLSKVKSVFEKHYHPQSGNLYLSSGAIGAAILDARAVSGDKAGAFAYAFIRRSVNLGEVRGPDQFRGALLVSFPGLDKPADLAQRLSNERANNKSAQISAIDRLKKAADEQEGRFAKRLKRANELALRTLRGRSDEWRAATSNWSEKAMQALADVEGIKNAYEEHMKLQAPVQYWRDKAAEHRSRERVNALWVAVFFLAATVMLGTAFYYGADLLLDAGRRASADGTQPTALYVVVTAALAALTTLVFWVGKLLTKLFLSEHHLRNDANERAVMTTTYLALTREGQASDTDRQIILSALFRNTPDGIVKEEGAGDLTLQAALAKFLSRP